MYDMLLNVYLCLNLSLLLLCGSDRISDSDNTQPEISMKALLPRELAAVKQVKRVGFTEEQALQVAGALCVGDRLWLC